MPSGFSFLVSFAVSFAVSFSVSFSDVCEPDAVASCRACSPRLIVLLISSGGTLCSSRRGVSFLVSGSGEAFASRLIPAVRG